MTKNLSAFCTGAVLFLFLHLSSSCGIVLNSSSSSNSTLLSYPALVLSDRASGYWRMDDSNATLVDKTTNGLNGTYSGGYTQGVAGAIVDGNAAVTFNGSSGLATTGYTQTTVTAYSAEAWFKHTASCGAFACALVNSRGNDSGLGTGRGLNILIRSTDLVQFCLDSSGIRIGVISQNTYKDGNWHHVVGTWSATSGTAVAPSQFALYIDGSAVSTTTDIIGSENSPLSGLGAMVIGWHGPFSSFFQGSVDDVAIYPYVLTPTQVSTHYQRGKNGL